MFTATRTELAALLEGAGPAASELAGRRRRQLAAEQAGPPLVAGSPAETPPDPAQMPAAVGRALRAMAVSMELEFATTGGVDRDGSFRGTGIGDRPYRGRACVARNAEDALVRLRPGDVLVTTTTSSAFSRLPEGW